jgi:protein-tyrosine-phosphatase
MIRVVFVCTANRCRSMMAEGIMRARWAREAGRGLSVSSMGVHGIDGMPPTDDAIRVCAENGIDIAAQRSRPLVPDELRHADLILVMEPFHKNFIATFHPEAAGQTFLLGAWPEKAAPKKAVVEDPVGGSMRLYRKVFAAISGHIDRIIPQLRNEYGI